MVLCVLLAVIGALLAIGSVVDMWLQTVSFGGPEGSPDIGGGRAARGLLLVAVGTLGPLGAARLLLGRVSLLSIAFSALTAVMLALAVLGLAL